MRNLYWKRDWRSQISMAGRRQKEVEDEAMRKDEGWLQPCPVCARQHLMSCGPTPGMLKKGQKWYELCIWEMTDFTSLRKKREQFAAVRGWGLTASPTLLHSRAAAFWSPSQTHLGSFLLSQSFPRTFPFTEVSRVTPCALESQLNWISLCLQCCKHFCG